MDQQTPSEQGSTPSLADRIASKFGGAPDAEPAQEAPPPAEAQPEPQAASETETPDGSPPPVDETFELEIDGEKFQLPKKLEKAVLQERDYTQKSQTLAEQRRTLELQLHQQRIAQMSQQFTQEASQQQQELQMLEAVIKQAQSTDWSALGTDDLIRRRLDLDNLRQRKADIEQALEGKRREWGEKQQAEITKLRAQSLEAISKRIPNWSDATAKAIREHALREGYTETELNSILDPRHVTTMWKAQQYDALKAKATPAPTTAKTVKTTPTNPMPQRVKEHLAFRKTLQKAPPGSPERKRAIEARAASIFSR
jgi:hypothetical protein